MTDQHGSSRSPEPPSQESDIRVKQDIQPLGDVGAILPLYSFKYLDEDTEYVGVMAQDVLKVRPDAVVTGEDGFYRVNYAKLGLRMVTRAEWDRSQDAVFAAPISSPEPPPDDSDVRLKQDIRPLGYVSPEPPDVPSDIRLKRSICKLGQVGITG
jgi:hypothetical protein